MEKYILLDDEATADVAFIAKGGKKSEMIANSCLALTDVMTELPLILETTTYQKEFVAEDLLGLVYDVLNHLLFLFDTEDLIFSYFSVNLKEDKNSLILIAKGEKYDPKKHIIKTHIKAVTFFGMKFDEEGLKITLDL